MSLSRAVVAAWAFGLAALAAAVVLLVPRDSASERDVEVALVDVSASTLASRPSWGSWIERELAAWRDRAARDGREVAVIAFGREARRVFGPGAARELTPRWTQLVEPATPDGALASCLARALDTASRLEPARVTLFSDGTFTGVDAQASASAVRAPIELVLPPPVERANARLVRFDVPASVEPGAPIAFTAEIECEGRALVPDAEVVLVVDAFRGRSEVAASRTYRVELPRADDAHGARRATVHGTASSSVDPVSSDAASTTLVARVELRDAATRRSLDAFAADDARTALVLARDSFLIAVVGDAPLTPSPATQWVEDDDFAEGVIALPISQLAARLVDVGAVVLLDVPDRALPADLLETFVASGGGLVDVAGASWVASPRRSSLAALEPVDAGDRPRSVLFLVDASGSMAGTAFEEVRAAIAKLVEVAPAGVSASVQTFAGELGERSELRGDAAGVLARLPEPRGPTRLVASLEMLVEDTALEPGTLVVVLSDGRDAERETALVRAEALRAAFAARGSELRVLAASESPDLELLGALAGREGGLVRAGALDREGARTSLASRFEAELQRGAWIEAGDLGLALVVSNDPDALRGLEALAPPRVSRLLRARPVDDARAVWRAPSGETALATRRIGNGTIAAVAAPTMDARTLKALARFVGRSPEDQRLRAAIEGSEIVVSAERGALAPLTAGRIEVEGQTFACELFAGAGSRDPWHELAGTLPQGALEVAPGAAAILRARDAAGVEFALPLVLPSSPEFDAEVRTFVAPRAQTAPSSSSAPHPAGPWVLAFAFAALGVAGFATFVARRAA